MAVFTSIYTGAQVDRAVGRVVGATAYSPTDFSGMGRVVLPKNIQSVSGTDKNVLTQAMMPTATGGNTVYVVQYDFTVSGTVTIPSGCVLYFDGGSIDGGSIVLDGTLFDGDVRLGTTLSLSGSCANNTAYQSWFIGNNIDSWHGFISNVSGVVTYEYANGTYSSTVLVNKAVNDRIIIHGNGASVSFPHTTAGQKAYNIYPSNTEEIVKTLTAVANKGDEEISINNLTDISIGDVCVLHDHATSSFCSERDYEQGEIIFIKNITDGKIVPDHGLYGTYKHLQDTTFVEDGVTKKAGPCTLTKFHSIDVRISDFNISLRGEVGKVRSYGLCIYKAVVTLENVRSIDFIFCIVLDCCFNSSVRNCECIGNIITYDGVDNYGLEICGCQNIEVNGGYYRGGNHGIAHGCHYTGNMSALARYSFIKGVTASSTKFNIGLDCHAGSDYIFFINNRTECISAIGDNITIKDNVVTDTIHIKTNLSYNYVITGNRFNLLRVQCRDWPSYLHTYVNYTPYTNKEVMIIENNICNYIYCLVSLTTVQRPNLDNVEIRINDNIIDQRLTIGTLPTDQTAYRYGGTVRILRNTMKMRVDSDGVTIDAKKIEMSGNDITGTGCLILNADTIDVKDNRLENNSIYICKNTIAPSSCNILRNIIIGTVSALPNVNSASGMCVWRVIGNVINNTTSISCYYSESTTYDTVYEYENTSDNEQAGYLTVTNANEVFDTYDYSKIGYQVSTTTANGQYSGAIQIDGTKPLHIIAITGAVTSVSLQPGKKPKEGHLCHVILSSASATTVSIVHDSTDCVCPDGPGLTSVPVPADGYVEVDFINANGKVYVRIV